MEQTEIDGFVIEPKNMAEGAGKLGPAQFQKDDVIGCERDIRAGWWIAAADSAERGRGLNVECGGG